MIARERVGRSVLHVRLGSTLVPVKASGGAIDLMLPDAGWFDRANESC